MDAEAGRPARGAGAPGEEAWVQRLAAQLARAAGADDEELITGELRGALLQLARVVAHGTERRNAPLATFVAGRYVEARRAQGVAAPAALAEVSRTAAALLADAGGATPPPPRAG